MFSLFCRRNAAALLLAVLAPCGQAAEPRPDDTRRERIEDWVHECNAAFCQIFTSLADAETRETVLSISVIWDPVDDAAHAVVLVPLDVALPPGVRLWVNAQHERIVPFQVCRANGCSAVLALDDDMLAALDAATTAVVEYVPYGSTRRASRPFSLDGFGAALSRLKASQAP